MRFLPEFRFETLAPMSLRNGGRGGHFTHWLTTQQACSGFGSCWSGVHSAFPSHLRFEQRTLWRPEVVSRKFSNCEFEIRTTWGANSFCRVFFQHPLPSVAPQLAASSPLPPLAVSGQFPPEVPAVRPGDVGGGRFSRSPDGNQELLDDSARLSEPRPDVANSRGCSFLILSSGELTSRRPRAVM